MKLRVTQVSDKSDSQLRVTESQRNANANDKMHPSCGGAFSTLCQVARRSRVILVVSW